MNNNLHLFWSRFCHESRVLRETASLIQSGLVENVSIAALHAEGLREQEEIDSHRKIWRVKLRSRQWPRCSIVFLLRLLEYYVKVISFAFARRKKIQLVNVHNLALLPLGCVLKKLCGAKLVYDAHELETEIFGLSGFQQKIAKCVERFLIKSADLVIVVGDGINKWYQEKYKLTRIVTALNCPEYVEISQPTSRLRDELHIPAEKKIVLYQGGLSRGRGIEGLLDAFSDDDGRHVLVFMGYGELESLIKEYERSHGNIYLKSAVEPAVILQYTASADIGVSYIDNPSLNDRLCLPNKLFEYIMARIPVIVNNAPEQQRLVVENQIGVVLEELTAQSLTRAFFEIEQMDLSVLSNNLRRVAQTCSWDNQERQMINAYRQHICRLVS